MAQYVGVLDGSKGVWGVRIPDVPGCHGGGATPEAAIADAISALREYAAHQQTKGIPLKAPRPVQEVIRDKEAEFDPKAGEVLVMVPLILDQARPVKANISLDAGLLEAIDEEAERRGLTRSAFFTSAALDKIGWGLSPYVEITRKRRESASKLERLLAEKAKRVERLAEGARHTARERESVDQKRHAQRRKSQ